MRLPLVSAGLVLALAAPLTCAGEDDDLGGAGAEGSVSQLLELVPDTAGTRSQVVYGSLARVRAATGIDEPSGDPGDYVGELIRASGNGWVVAEPFRSHALQITPEEVGFDLTAIDASIEAGTPPEQVAVFTGRLDAAEVDDALTSFEPFADDVEVGEHADVATYRFGAEGTIDVANRSGTRPLGESLRLGVDEGVVWWTRTDDALDGALDAAAGDEDSLADDDGFAATAGALDELKAYTAVFTADADAYDGTDVAGSLGRDLTPEQVEAIEEQLGDAGGAGLVRWDVAALGETLVDGQPGLAIVLGHEDEASATDNVERLETVLREGQSRMTRRPWSDLCDDPDVRRDGTTVIATCDTETGGRAVQILFARDSLLLWS